MDSYKILNINKTDNYNIIKKAYHNLVKLYHPDRLGKVDNKIYEINQAYRNLIIIPKNPKSYIKTINCSYNPEQLLINDIYVPLKFRLYNKNYIYSYNLQKKPSIIRLFDYQIKINLSQDNSNNYFHINNNIINIISIRLLPFINGFNYDLILNHISLKIFFKEPYLNQMIKINNKLINKNINFYIFIKLLSPTNNDLLHFKKINNARLDNYVIYS